MDSGLSKAESSLAKMILKNWNGCLEPSLCEVIWQKVPQMVVELIPFAYSSGELGVFAIQENGIYHTPRTRLEMMDYADGDPVENAFLRLRHGLILVGSPYFVCLVDEKKGTTRRVFLVEVEESIESKTSHLKFFPKNRLTDLEFDQEQIPIILTALSYYERNRS